MADGCGHCQSHYVPYVYPAMGAITDYKAQGLKNKADTLTSMRDAYPFPAGIPFINQSSPQGLVTKFGSGFVLPLILQSWLVDQFAADWWCQDRSEPPPGAPGVLQQNLYTALVQSGLGNHDVDSAVIVAQGASKQSPVTIPLGSHSIGTFNARRSLYKDTEVVITIEKNSNDDRQGLQARISGVTQPVQLDGLDETVYTNLLHFRGSTDPAITQNSHWYGLVPPDKSLVSTTPSWKVYARLKSFEGTLPVTHTDPDDTAVVHAYTDSDIAEITGTQSPSTESQLALQAAYVRPRVSWPVDANDSRLIPRYRVGTSSLTGADDDAAIAAMNTQTAQICRPTRATEAESVCNCQESTYATPYGAGRDAYTRYFTLVQTVDNRGASDVFAPACAGYCNDNPRATPVAAGVAYPSAQSRANSGCPDVMLCENNINIRNAQVSKINIQAACDQMASRGKPPP